MAEQWVSSDGWKPEGKQPKAPVEPNVLTPADGADYRTQKAEIAAELGDGIEHPRLPARKRAEVLWTCSGCGFDNTYHHAGMCPAAEDVELPEFRPDIIGREGGL